MKKTPKCLLTRKSLGKGLYYLGYDSCEEYDFHSYIGANKLMINKNSSELFFTLDSRHPSCSFQLQIQNLFLITVFPNLRKKIDPSVLPRKSSWPVLFLVLSTANYRTFSVAILKNHCWVECLSCWVSNVFFV